MTFAKIIECLAKHEPKAAAAAMLKAIDTLIEATDSVVPVALPGEDQLLEVQERLGGQPAAREAAVAGSQEGRRDP